MTTLEIPRGKLTSRRSTVLSGKLKIWAVSAVGVISLIAILAFMHSRIESLNQELAESRLIAQQSVIQLQELQSAISRVQQERLVFEAETAELNRQYRQVRDELESMRGREATVLARPTLVERMINRSFQAQQRSITCLTEGLCDD